MSESRDRLPRPEDVAAIFSRRRRSIGSIGILADEPERSVGTPLRMGAMAGTRGFTGVAAMRGRGGFGTSRLGNGRGRNLYGSPVFGRENTPPVSGSGRRGVRGRGSNSVLPSWYPRTPLRDITAIVRAIERRRAHLRESEVREIESPVHQHHIVHDPSILPFPSSGAQLEHKFSTTPKPVLGTKHCMPSVGKVPKILLDITNQKTGDSDFLTPQKKLLNSIDTVEKVVMEELYKLKRTPTAKKAEREKRVRTLMSMR